MRERDCSESEQNLPAQEGQGFDAALERLLQHGPGVERALNVLIQAQDMDSSLREQGGMHPLSRRFVIFSGGSDYFPFPHFRVELHPRHTGVSALGVEGIMLRFAVEPKEDQKMSFSGAVSITYGLPGGITADYILTDSLWEPYADVDDLLIEDGVLQGVVCPTGNSSFRIEEFDSVLSDMEPALQNNTTAT